MAYAEALEGPEQQSLLVGVQLEETVIIAGHPGTKRVLSSRKLVRLLATGATSLLLGLAVFPVVGSPHRPWWSASGIVGLSATVGSQELPTFHKTRAFQILTQSNKTTKGDGVCDVEGLMFTMDVHTFNPPLWKFDAGSCVPVMEGSSSWKAYGFITKAACVEKCTSTQVHKEGMCSYEDLVFMEDFRTYDPPLWKFEDGKCVAVKSGSGSWNAYAFASEQACADKCTPTNLPEGGRCDYESLVFMEDFRTYDPPLWKFEDGKCVAVKRGSGSWNAYAFTTEQACAEKCTRTELPDEARCHYENLPFTQDFRTYDPPLWKFEDGNCVAVKNGSGSWMAYGFTEQQACFAKCDLTQSEEVQQQTHQEPQHGRCDYSGLIFTMDVSPFDQPLWRFMAGKCEPLKEGSSSWRAYAFATQTECLAKCGEGGSDEVSIVHALSTLGV